MFNIVSVKAQDGSPLGNRSADHATSRYNQPTWDGAITSDRVGETLHIILDGDLTIDRSEWDTPDGFRAKVLYADSAWCVVHVPSYSDTLWALNFASGTYHRLLYRRNEQREFCANTSPQTLADEMEADDLPGEGVTQDRVKLAIDLDKLQAEGTIRDWSEDEKSLGLVVAGVL